MGYPIPGDRLVDGFSIISAVWLNDLLDRIKKLEAEVAQLKAEKKS